MNRFLVGVALAGLACLHTPLAAAQNPGRGSLDVNATILLVNGGVYPERGAASLNLLGAFGLREISYGAWIAAVDAGVLLDVGHGDTCMIVPGRSGCVPELRPFTTWTALAGWESGRGGQAGLRLLVGPTLYSGGGSANVGAAVRADLATRSLFHFALTATGRAALVSLPGGATGLRAAGIGIRIR